MWLLTSTLVSVLLLLAPAREEDICQLIAGAFVVADDGTFLGTLSNQRSPDSILNEYGTHGSPYGVQSIWNQYATYGRPDSPISPFNPSASSPPILIKGGNVIAVLTVNKALRGALDPYIVKRCEFR
jgi:hypothetical protein